MTTAACKSVNDDDRRPAKVISHTYMVTQPAVMYRVAKVISFYPQITLADNDLERLQITLAAVSGRNQAAAKVISQSDQALSAKVIKKAFPPTPPCAPDHSGSHPAALRQRGPRPPERSAPRCKRRRPTMTVETATGTCRCTRGRTLTELWTRTCAECGRLVFVLSDADQARLDAIERLYMADRASGKVRGPNR